jgi:hypothetical protein
MTSFASSGVNSTDTRSAALSLMPARVRRKRRSAASVDVREGRCPCPVVPWCVGRKWVVRVRWRQFEAVEPRLAAVGAQKLIGPGVVLVGTVRRDGTARISAVEPLLFDGELWLSMGWGSRKVTDLRRDPRLVVRSIVTSRDGSDGDFILRGVAMAEDDPARQQSFADEVAGRIGWRPEVGKFHLFWIDIDDVTFIRWDDATNDQFVTRWPDRLDLVRRGMSATSNAPAELFHSGLLTTGSPAS